MKNASLFLTFLLYIGIYTRTHAQTAATPADAFVESVGINIHGNYGQYSNRTNTVVNTLTNIGFRHVRDAGGGQHFPGYDLWAWQKDVADRAGVKFDLIYGLGNSESTVAGQCDYLGTRVWGIEGHNEVGSDQHDALVDFQKMLWNVSQTRSNINVLTWTYSVAVKFTERNHSNVENWTDFGAIHPYHKFGSNSQHNAGPMSSCYWDDMWGVGYIPGIRGQMVPNKPLISTENGFSTGYQSDDQTGMSELASAKYNVRACLENWRLNFKKTYLYELINMDDNNGYTESWYGVAKTDGTLKPAGKALKNMIAILQEKGKDNISTTPLNYTLSCPSLSTVPDKDGYSNEVHSVLLQKSTGVYYLVLWQECSSYDWGQRKDINVPTVPVTVNFGKTFSFIKTYLPLNSTAVVGQWSNQSSHLFDVPDHPIIIELQNVACANKPVTGTGLNKTSSTIALCKTEQLSAIITPLDACDQTVSWISDKPAVATVDASGLVTGVSVGSATITVTTKDGSFTAKCVVTVTDPQVAYNNTIRTIPGRIEAEDYDTGGECIAYHDTDSGNNGGQYRTEDTDIKTTGDNQGGGYDVGWGTNGEWLEYTVNATSGSYDIKLRVGSANTGNKINVKLDGIALGTVTVPNMSNWNDKSTVVIPNVSITGGNKKIIRLEISGDGVDINWIEFLALTTGIESHREEVKVKVYPNPSTGSFAVELNPIMKEVKVEIINALGEKVYETLSQQNELEINNLVKGIYILKAWNNDEIIVKKIIVN